MIRSKQIPKPQLEITHYLYNPPKKKTGWQTHYTYDFTYLAPYEVCSVSCNVSVKCDGVEFTKISMSARFIAKREQWIKTGILNKEENLNDVAFIVHPFTDMTLITLNKAQDAMLEKQKGTHCEGVVMPKIIEENIFAEIDKTLKASFVKYQKRIKQG